jgi:SAM-dependent methyltransferase
MPDEQTDRRSHWQRVYTQRSPADLSWYQREPTYSLRLIRDTALSKHAPVIDVGGGASVLVDCLLRDGFTRVAVLDVSAAALEHARHRLGNAAQSVEWIDSDVTDFVPPHPFVLWHDRATFHFLTDPADRRKYVQALGRSLEVDGHAIIATFAIGGPDRCSGLDVVQYDAARLSRELGDEFRLVAELTEAHVTPAGKEQRFAYFHFVKTASKQQLDAELDEALRETFPASDPTAVSR